MNKSRLILLAVAAVAGGGAFFMVATGDDDNAATQIVEQVVPEARGPETVRVLVADRAFSRGDRIDPAATAWVKWPADDLPPYLITEENEAFYETLPTLRARTTIYENEPIIAAKTVAQGDKGMMAALLSPGMRAVSAPISGHSASSGFVLPGDTVDVLATSRQGNGQVTETAFSGLRVIAIDQSIQEEGNPKTIQGGTVTFELRPDQVEDFVTVRTNATLTLVLRSIFDAEVPDVPSAEIVVLRYGRSQG